MLMVRSAQNLQKLKNMWIPKFNEKFKFCSKINSK